MKPYYSIIMLVINPIAQERIGVGLILSYNGKFKVDFSQKRLGFASSLLGESKGLVKQIENQIRLKIDELNLSYAHSKESIELFKSGNIINNNYFEYLSKYSNNLIQFSEPKLIKSEKIDFDKLFSLLISNEYETPEVSIVYEEKSTLIKNVEQKLIKKVHKKVHTHLNITSKYLPSLYFNYELDCIGLNGNFISAKALPLDQSIQTLHHKTSDYITLANILEKKYDKVNADNNFFLISDEPSEIKSEEYKFWEKLRKLPKLELVSSEQSDKIAEMIVETKATTFFPELD